jgi:hypothetical protein
LRLRHTRDEQLARLRTNVQTGFEQIDRGKATDYRGIDSRKLAAEPRAVFRIFHTFSGSRFNVAGNGRDWILTTVWVLAMDALAASLIVTVLGSYYMWYRLKQQRRLGLLALSAGVLSCGVFLAGLM